MTDREIMQQALTVLKAWDAVAWRTLDTIEGLEAALAKPEQSYQESMYKQIAVVPTKKTLLPTQPEQKSKPMYVMGNYAGEGKVVNASFGLPKGAFEFAPYTGKGEASKIKHSLEQMLGQEPTACGYDETVGMCTNNPCCEQAQPEQEPVAKHVCNLWINPETSFYEVDRCTHPINEVFPVYTAPPKREWVGLTDDERNEMIGRIQHDQYTRQRDLINSTQIITEMYLKEKNT